MQKVKALCLVLSLLFWAIPPAYTATHTINSNTTWTNQGAYTAGDNIVITSTGNLRIISGGNNGGNLYVTLVGPSGLFQIDNGGVLDLSAVAGNGNGGFLNINSLGTGSSIIVNGIIRANALGSGRGGTINMNADNYTLGATGAIESMAATTGYGGVVNLTKKSGTLNMITPGFTIDTSGVATGTQNLITLTSDAVNIDANLIANGGPTGKGGKVMVVANNGVITIRDNTTISAIGSASGEGGTLELKSHINTINTSVDSCVGASCTGTALVRISDSANVDVSGGAGTTDTGVLRIGRSNYGAVVHNNASNTGGQNIQGLGEVRFGDDGFTTSVTFNGYDESTDFGGSSPDIYLKSLGGIAAVSNNNFNKVTIDSAGGNMLLTDKAGGMTSSVKNATGTVRVTAQGGSDLVFEDSTSTSGTIELYTDGNITATNNNNVLGNIMFYGEGGPGTPAGDISVKNIGNLTVSGLQGATATMETTGLNSFLYATGINVTGDTQFTSNGDVVLRGIYGGTVAGTGGRTYIRATSGDINSAGMTATSSVGWNGSADESMVIVADKGDILGTGYATSGAANMRMQAGTYQNQYATSDINISDVVSLQHAAFYATGDSNGDGSGTSIKITGNSRVAGHTTATGIDTYNGFFASKGSIDIGYTAGNLKTALVWADKGVNLSTTGTNGDIIQDVSTYGTGFNHGKTVYSNTADINLTANGGQYSYIDTGAVTMGGNITAKASGDFVGNGNSASVKLVGYSQGDTTISNMSGGNVTGQVILGTAIGDPNDFSGNTYYDTLGNLSVKANHDLFYYGFLKGTVAATGRNIRVRVDKGDIKLNNVFATATSGNSVFMKSYMGSITGNGLITAGTGSVVLEAGSDFPRDKASHVTITGASIAGNLTATVAGDSNTNTTGNSVVVSGSLGGSATVHHLTNDIYLGTVTTP